MNAAIMRNKYQKLFPITLLTYANYNKYSSPTKIQNQIPYKSFLDVGDEITSNWQWGQWFIIESYFS
jgi:hypothetical protein|tara:strand:+ start:1375 stop:1575 length:201 start_codon:yes stop_codon:yes gene_type:complete